MGREELQDVRRQIIERLPSARHAQRLHRIQQRRDPLGAQHVFEEVVGEGRAAVRGGDGREGADLEVDGLQAGDYVATVETALYIVDQVSTVVR